MAPPAPLDDPDPRPSGTELAPGVRVPDAALRFTFTSSTGPGGQNVNKRATKAELRLALADLPLNEAAKARLAALAGQRLTEAGEILLTSDEHRSQGRNRAECLDRLRDLILRAMIPPKKRRPSRPTRGSIERRLDTKRQRSEAKRRRRPPPD